MFQIGTERGIDHCFLLFVMQRKIAHCRRGSGSAQRVVESHARTHVAQQVMLDAVPCALVARLFLAPQHFACIGISGDLGGKVLVRERIKLLQAHDGHVLYAALAPGREQFVIDLAAAKDDAPDCRAIQRVRFIQYRLERAFCQPFQRRSSILAAQQALRREHDQRLAVRAQHLAAQQVEHLRRRRRDAHLDVVIRAQLQIALDAAGGMLRALPFVTVRQQHHQSAQAPPLGLARGDELVDHHLRAVGEIAELRLPDHQRIGLGGGITVFEGQHRLLGQDRIDHQQVRLPGFDIAQRQIQAFLPLHPVLVVQHGMAMEKSAASAILPGQAYRDNLP